MGSSRSSSSSSGGGGGGSIQLNLALFRLENFLFLL
jgi:hypothetical protein